ncbi:hypothetical protein Ciccas_008625 [Cichlidogyrus casuarinus]|uniref:Uncharacterized protein n=1 Tax=Cichlidogyrus casuarinus TaxID=1844966 RepID=A0ABD2PZS5_9PLAT
MSMGSSKGEAKKGRSRTMSLNYHKNEAPITTMAEVPNQLYPFRINMMESESSAVYDLQATTLSSRERWLDALDPSRYKIPADIDFSLWGQLQL